MEGGGGIVEAIVVTQREGRLVPDNKATGRPSDAFYWVRPGVVYTRLIWHHWW
jgi:hypothetical protein